MKNISNCIVPGANKFLIFVDATQCKVTIPAYKKVGDVEGAIMNAIDAWEFEVAVVVNSTIIYLEDIVFISFNDFVRIRHGKFRKILYISQL